MGLKTLLPAPKMASIFANFEKIIDTSKKFVEALEARKVSVASASVIINMSAFSNPPLSLSNPTLYDEHIFSLSLSLCHQNFTFITYTPFSHASLLRPFKAERSGKVHLVGDLCKSHSVGVMGPYTVFNANKYATFKAMHAFI